MIELYPLIEPYDSGMLEVGDGNSIYWETSGNPQGKPVVILHGGPGQGSSGNMRRATNPKKYRIIIFDQRGCGKSLPHASDPGVDLNLLSTDRLISDLEVLRNHLKIESWLVNGASWGSTLALLYAQKFPHRVTEMVLSMITTGTRAERDWLYRGASLFFPEEYTKFRNVVPEKFRDEAVIEGYCELMKSSDPEVLNSAVNAWCTWEEAVLSLEPNSKPNLYTEPPDKDTIAFVRICSFYASKASWLEEDQILRNVNFLSNINAILIHGRLDLSCPLKFAWNLVKQWPKAELIALSDSGHKKSDSKRRALLQALDRFAET